MGAKKRDGEPKAFDKEATDRLWEAVARGGSRDDKRVAQALARGANPNADDWEGRETPLLMAILMGRVGAAKILLAAGADPEKSNDYDQRPLELAGCAAAGKARQLVNLLAEGGARVDAANSKGWSALMHACDVGSAEGAEALLDLGADIEFEDSKGWTPLVTAIYGARDAAGRACLEIMVARGARVTERAVERAAAWGSVEVASWLGAVLLARAESSALEESSARPAHGGPRAARL